MNYKDLQDEVIALRFNEKLRSSVQRWINLKYNRLWHYADWYFKRVPATDFPVEGGLHAPSMPAEFAQAVQLWGAEGSALEYLLPQEWESRHLNSTDYGTPSEYTVIDRQIYLGPAPDNDATFRLSYDRRLAHVDPVEGIIGGTLQIDGDEPVWPVEHDYVLVLEAVMLGQVLGKDDGFQMIATERDALLQAMIYDCVGNQEREAGQYGRR